MMSHQVVGQMGHGAGHDARGRRRSRGFTLMELMVVVGIIALLVALLVTAVSKARSAAKRVQCITNLNTIGSAIHQYLVDNSDTFPLAASNKGHKDGDFLYWQSTASGTGSQFYIDMIGSAGVGKYIGALDDLSPGGLQALRCPADDRLEAAGFLATSPQQTQAHTPYTAGIYPFSYVINIFMISGNYPDVAPELPAIARTMSKVKDASEKIMVYEEDARTINDGVGDLRPLGSTTNLLSCRHDIREPLSIVSTTKPPDPDAPIAVSISSATPPQIVQMNHMGSTGNVLFADGHAETVGRGFAHVKAHYAPDPNAPSLSALP